MSTYLDEYKKHTAALRKATAAAARIADEANAKLAAIDERMDLDRGAKDKLKAMVRAEASRQFDAFAKETRKAAERAQAAQRKAARRDEWDSATEARIASAERRWTALFASADKTQARKLAEDLIAEADRDGDLAMLLSLRRSLPMVARARGAEIGDDLRERLDLLQPDKTVHEAVAYGRELRKGLPRIDHTLSAIEYEIAGRGKAPVLPSFDGEMVYRHGYRAGSDGSVQPPEAGRPAEDADAALEREYRRLIGAD